MEKEIGRISHDGKLYLVFASIAYYEGEDHVWFEIRISSKSSKKKNIDQWSLEGKTFNLGIMRAIEKIISNYLNENKPDLLLVSAYKDSREKRLKLYTTILERLGYEKVKRIEERFEVYLKFQRIVPEW